MNKLVKVTILGVAMMTAFYCGVATRADLPDATADAGVDAMVDADAGVDGGTVCDCPEPPTTCQDCVQTAVVDVTTTVDGTAVVPLPGFDTEGVTVQVWSRVFAPNASHWIPAGPECEPVVFTEAPHYAPNIPVPSIYYTPGVFRQCRVVMTWKEPND